MSSQASVLATTRELPVTFSCSQQQKVTGLRRRAGLMCALLIAGACGNTTTREERLAARGIRAETSAVATGADSTAPATDSLDGSATAGAVSDAAPAAAAAGSGQAAPNAPVGGAGRTATERNSPTVAATPGRTASNSAASGGSSSAGGPSTATPGGATPNGPGPSGAAAPGPGKATVKKSEILFGSFGVEAGVLGVISGPAPPAIRAWIADVNSRGGLGGHPVRVIMVDDGGDPARAQAAVRQMVEKDSVIGFFYPYAIGTLVPVLPYLEEKGIPVLGQMGAETLADYSAAVFQPFMAADKGTAWGFVKADPRPDRQAQARHLLVPGGGRLPAGQGRHQEDHAVRGRRGRLRHPDLLRPARLHGRGARSPAGRGRGPHHLRRHRDREPGGAVGPPPELPAGAVGDAQHAAPRRLRLPGGPRRAAQLLPHPALRLPEDGRLPPGDEHLPAQGPARRSSAARPTSWASCSR